MRSKRLSEPPYSCAINHQNTDIQVVFQQRPELPYDTQGSCEEFHLARTVLAYTARQENEMDTKQLRAMTDFRSSLGELKQKLSEKDLSTKFTQQVAGSVLQQLNDIFFFREMSNIVFDYKTTFPYPFTVAGQSSVERHVSCRTLADACTLNGQHHHIRMHPTRTGRSLQYMKQIGLEIYEARLGTLLHELIHCFLFQHACV